MRCPVCHEETEGRVCPHCGHHLEAAYALAKASGRFYNEGLRYARRQQYEHARFWLRKAVRYNGENIQARNLLGLVYMQTGEIGEAVGQWSQSAAISNDANPAEEYLKKASRTMGKAAQLKQAVRLYNEGLALLQDGQRDTALLHLKKAVALSDRYTRARKLLALYWMDEREFDKAEVLLREVEAIDPEDPQLPHLKRLCAEDGEEWRSSREGKEIIGQKAGTREEKGEESPSMPIFAGKSPKRSVRTYLRQNASVVQFLLFALGLGVGLMFMALLVTPQQMSELRQQSNELAAKLSQIQSEQDEETDRLAALQEEAALMTEEHGALVTEYDLYKENTTALLEAWALYQEGNLTGAGKSLSKIQTEGLDAEQRELYEWLLERAKMEPESDDSAEENQ